MHSSPVAWRALQRITPSIAHVPHRGILSITGSHSTEFLNGLLASSIREPNKNLFAAFLHAQGRVMYDIFLYATLEGYLLEYDSRLSEAPPLLSYLKRHILRSKVKIKSFTDEFDVWAAWGSAKDHKWETKRHWNWARSGAVEPLWNELAPWGVNEDIIYDRRGNGMGRRLLVRKGDRPEDASTHDIVSSEDYKLHRIFQGVAEGVPDIPPMQAFPIDSNLDMMGGLDFRKGCYVGQELTVRTYHTGVIRKRILPVLISNPDSASNNMDLPSFPEGLHITPEVVDSGLIRSRIRGSGKLLSNWKGVGLALLRLDHLTEVQNGSIKLGCKWDLEGNSSSWVISPWWPDWWPHKVDEPNLNDHS